MEKLKNLQQFVQSAADTAWEHKMSCSIYDTMPISFGSHLETILSSRSDELSMLLNDIAIEQANKQNQTPEPPDFINDYIRYSSGNLDYIEVFVGNKWVIVPSDAKVNFNSTISNNKFSFSVNIEHGSDSASFTSTESLQSYQQNNLSLHSEKLNVEQQNDYVSKEEFNWMRLGGSVYNKTKNNVGLLDGLNSLYEGAPKDFKRTYSYKIHKVTKAAGKPVKAGKIFQGAQKVSKNLRVLGPIGNALSIGTIGYEVKTGTWDSHTFVDGVLLVVGIAAISLEAPIIVAGLAIYGILDYAFDIGGAIDDNIGRNSGFWDKKPISSFPRDNKPLFNKIKIDNTYVAPKIIMPKRFKD